MKIALVGYGKMGREIERQAQSRGHEVVAIFDPGLGRGENPLTELPGDVAFEFTGPGVAEANVVALLRSGRSVVCGTTGWRAPEPVRRAAEQGNAGAVIAPNYSIGMNLFYRIVEHAAKSLGATKLYEPYVAERHHRGKRDAPSGTALALAQRIAGAAPRELVVRYGTAEGPVPAGAVHVASVRAGHEPGTHEVGFDGEHDVVTLTHAARGRSGFALGAVLAGEWLVAGARRGVFGFDEVLRDLLAGSHEDEP